MSYLFIPLFIIAGLVVLMGVVLLLGRIQGGRFIRPVFVALAKIPFMRRLFEKSSNAMLERQNPELASAMKKLQRAGANVDPAAQQKALSRLSAAERRAVLDFHSEHGPEPSNRQERRRAQRLQQGSRPAGGAKKPGKKRR